MIQALQDRNYVVRNRATRALGRIGAKDAVPALIQALKDENKDVRVNAVQALMQIGTPGALKAVEEYQSRQ